MSIDSVSSPVQSGLKTFAAKAFAAQSPDSGLASHRIARREPLDHDVLIDILFCGVCHSDLHAVRNDWRDVFATNYPCVPGHEIVGKVSRVGQKVTRFKPGDIAAVGCMIDSCRDCSPCKQGVEQYCEKGLTPTYNGPDKFLGGVTYGGYAENIVVDEAYVLRVPAQMNLAAAAPLLCAGITTYSPMRHRQVQKGHKVGIVGLGGLGHMGIKIAHALGAHTVLITTSPEKGADAKRLGADEVIISKNPAEFAKHAGSFDFILDTVSAQHDINALLWLLKFDGAMTLVGLPEKPLSLLSFPLVAGRRQLTGSSIGGIKETQEMLDFCAKHDIACDVEVIDIDQINHAYDRLAKSDVKYRFVIDMASLKR